MIGHHTTHGKASLVSNGHGNSIVGAHELLATIQIVVSERQVINSALDFGEIVDFINKPLLLIGLHFSFFRPLCLLDGMGLHVCICFTIHGDAHIYSTLNLGSVTCTLHMHLKHTAKTRK